MSLSLPCHSFKVFGILVTELKRGVEHIKAWQSCVALDAIVSFTSG